MMVLIPCIPSPAVAFVPAVAHEVSKHMAQCTIPVYLTGKVGSIVYTGNRQGTTVQQLHALHSCKARQRTVPM